MIAPVSRTGGMGSTRCLRCGAPVYLYGIHTCSPLDAGSTPPSSKDETFELEASKAWNGISKT